MENTKELKEQQHLDNLAKVCHYFREGKGPTEIYEIMRGQHKVKLSVQAPYDLIKEAIKKNLITVDTPEDNFLSESIKKDFVRGLHLQRVSITRTEFVDDIAVRAAFVLIDLVKDAAEKNREKAAKEKHEEAAKEKRKVRIGFSGGHTMRRTFRQFAQLLTLPAEKDSLPETIVCQALVAGFDTSAPGTDPTSFFVYLSDLENSGNLQLKTEFVLLHAPPVVRPAGYQDLFEIPALKLAWEHAQNLDIIVTSAAVLKDPHSQLRKYLYSLDPNILDRLQNEGKCLGDILWLPISSVGAIDLSSYPYRPVTLVDLKDLKRNDLKVVLALGPCADPQGTACEHKTEILRAILSLPHVPITHLITDKLTANELLRKETEKEVQN